MTGAKELFWRECYALAAENYSFGQESQPNGLILLIQPTGLHTAALSFTAREEDSLKEGEKREVERGKVGGIWTGLASKNQRVVFFTKEKQSCQTSNSILGCVWTSGNHTKSLTVVFD